MGGAFKDAIARFVAEIRKRLHNEFERADEEQRRSFEGKLAPANTVFSVEQSQPFFSGVGFPSGGWQTFSQNFTANSDLTLLTFIDTRGAFNAGIYLDDVSVQAVSSVPGPIAGAGLPGLILADGGLIGWGRGRKKIA